MLPVCSQLQGQEEIQNDTFSRRVDEREQRVGLGNTD